MPRNPNPTGDREPEPGALIPRNPVLRDADTRDLQAAADELRERTMTLEPDEMWPAKRALIILVVAAAVIAFATIIFRAELRALLGLL